MRTHPSRSQSLNRWAITLAIIAVAVLAGLAIPLLAGLRFATPVTADPLVKTVAELAAMSAMRRQQTATPDAASQRMQRMEAELRALQAEAAKNPARPTMAEMERQLNRMVSERGGDSEVSRLERLATWSLGLALALAVALGGLAITNLRRGKSTVSAA